MRRRQPSASRSQAGRSLEVPGLKLVGGFKGLSAEPIAIAWSQDGRALAATGQAGAVGVWLETAGGRPWLLQGHDTSKYVLGVAWHPSGPVLATAGHDGTVRLWDMDSGAACPGA